MPRTKTTDSRERSRAIHRLLPATTESIAMSLRIHRTTVYRHLVRLERESLVTYVDGKYRARLPLNEEILERMWPTPLTDHIAALRQSRRLR